MKNKKTFLTKVLIIILSTFFIGMGSLYAQIDATTQKAFTNKVKKTDIKKEKIKKQEEIISENIVINY